MYNHFKKGILCNTYTVHMIKKNSDFFQYPSPLGIAGGGRAGKSISANQVCWLAGSLLKGRLFQHVYQFSGFPIYVGKVAKPYGS